MAGSVPRAGTSPERNSPFSPIRKGGGFETILVERNLGGEIWGKKEEAWFLFCKWVGFGNVLPKIRAQGGGLAERESMLCGIEVEEKKNFTETVETVQR